MNTLRLTNEEFDLVRAAVKIYQCNMLCDFPKAYERARTLHEGLERKLKEASK